MADISVLHYRPDIIGGVEAVLAHTIDALESQHSVTLISATEAPITDLNEQFGTQIRDVETIEASIGPLPCEHLIPFFERLRGGRLGVLRALRFTIFHRAAAKHCEDADLIINTNVEMGYPTADIQYNHFPRYNRRRNPLDSTPDNTLINTIDELVSHIEGLGDYGGNEELLANSDWTAEIVKEIYGARPKVVYPPVDPVVESTKDFEDRENGFVMIGSIRPGKNVEDGVKIVDELREQGHEAHIHLIGTTSRRPNYSQRIQELAESRDYVKIEGRVSRSRLRDLLGSHQYGLHAKRNEHFGIAVAEMAAAGLVLFLHNSGGQREIVGKSKTFLYDDTEHAVETISKVLSLDDGGASLREQLPDARDTFGVERFQNEVITLAENHLEQK